jgi:hypothetical protein
VSAGIALVALVVGTYKWVPRTEGLPGYANRLSYVLTGLGAAYLVARSQSVLDAPDFGCTMIIVIFGVAGWRASRQ